MTAIWRKTLIWGQMVIWRQKVICDQLIVIWKKTVIWRQMVIWKRSGGSGELDRNALLVALVARSSMRVPTLVLTKNGGAVGLLALALALALALCGLTTTTGSTWPPCCSPCQPAAGIERQMASLLFSFFEKNTPGAYRSRNIKYINHGVTELYSSQRGREEHFVYDVPEKPLN